MGRRPSVPVLFEIEEMALGFLLARRDHWHRRDLRTMGYHTAIRLGVVLPSPDRFWSMVNETDSGCWEWQGGMSGDEGYGRISVAGESYSTHRCAWMLAYGPIPEGSGYHGTCVCHRCDNHRCVRPDHLFLGTQLDNMRDRDMKGRGVGGPNQPSIAA